MKRHGGVTKSHRYRVKPPERCTAYANVFEKNLRWVYQGRANAEGGMQVDLEADGQRVEGLLPRFQQAGVSPPGVPALGRCPAWRWLAVGVGAALFVALLRPLSIWPAVLVNLCVGLAGAGGGVAVGVLGAAGARRRWATPPAGDARAGRYARLLQRFWHAARGARVVADRRPAVAAGWALISLSEVLNLGLPATGLGPVASVGAALAVALAFALLVFERHWPRKPPRNGRKPGSPGSCRVAILCLVVGAVCLLFAGARPVAGAPGGVDRPAAGAGVAGVAAEGRVVAVQPRSVPP